MSRRKRQSWSRDGLLNVGIADVSDDVPGPVYFFRHVDAELQHNTNGNDHSQAATLLLRTAPMPEREPFSNSPNNMRRWLEDYGGRRTISITRWKL